MLALGWIICGIAACAVAVSKNRSGIGWFFLGILLGPIALLMVGFMPKLEPEPEISNVLSDPGPLPWEEEQVQEKTCPYCAETIKAAAIVCKHCGRDLPSEQADPK